jgi:hypothetical protein
MADRFLADLSQNGIGAAEGYHGGLAEKQTDIHENIVPSPRPRKRLASI